MSFVFSVETCD